MTLTRRASIQRSDESAGSADTAGVPGILARFRRHTHDLHGVAERSGYISELLHGRGSRRGYASVLRNLLPAYKALEQGLERHRHAVLFGGVCWTNLYRTAAIERDLGFIAGPQWRASVALLPAGLAYADRVAAAAGGNGERLIAHAYVRYLGDLSGGQALKRLLGRSLALGPEALSFYEFPGIADQAEFKSDFRASVDAAAASMIDVEAVVDEAVTAFRLNIQLSNSILAAAQADTEQALSSPAHAEG